MDYYIVFAGDNNYIKNCYIERIGDLEHGGAGIGIKEYGENNLFEDCTAKNLKNASFYVRWAGVQNNEFRNCKAIGVPPADVTAFVIRDGASYNEFNSCISEGCLIGMRFEVSGEDQNYTGSYNLFNNCIVKDAEYPIYFSEWNTSYNGPAENNSFINCNFINGLYLIASQRANTGHKIVNCIITGMTTGLNGSTLGFPDNFDYEYSSFYNNAFATPTGTGNISDNPQFVDEDGGDFHLQAGSPCIDAGTSTDAPPTDFDGIPRPQGSGFDIGMYEYEGSSGINENDFNKIAIYPNPTTGKIYLPYQLLNEKYQVLSTLGAVVKRGIIETKIIDLSELKSGIYILKITGNKAGKIKVAKLIKE